MLNERLPKTKPCRRVYPRVYYYMSMSISKLLYYGSKKEKNKTNFILMLVYFLIWNIRTISHLLMLKEYFFHVKNCFETGWKSILFIYFYWKIVPVKKILVFYFRAKSTEKTPGRWCLSNSYLLKWIYRWVNIYYQKNFVLYKNRVKFYNNITFS